MAGEITLTIKVSAAVAERVETALCEGAGVPVSGANAKAIVIAMIKQRVVAVEKHKKRGTVLTEEEAVEQPGGLS